MLFLSDELLSQLRACIDEKAPEWRLHAASTVLLLGEIVFGASPAWVDVSGWQHLDQSVWHSSEAGVGRSALVCTAAAAIDDVMVPVLFAANEGTGCAARIRVPLLDIDCPRRRGHSVEAQVVRPCRQIRASRA